MLLSRTREGSRRVSAIVAGGRRGNNRLQSVTTTLSPSFLKSRDDDVGNDLCQRSHHQQQQSRLYHSSQKKEIVPILVGVGVVGLIGRYSWKALNRMDEEWEDYQWQLQQYERQRLKEDASANAPTTIGVDFGSVYLKLSALNQGTKPELIPTAQGERYRFTGFIVEQDETGGDGAPPTNIITGKPALDKFFYQPSMNDDSPVEEQVVLPYRELQKSSHDEVTKLVQQIFVPAVGEAMERISSGGAQSNNSNNNTIRTVLTLPPTFYNQHGETIFQNYHDDKHHTVTVPDPVAAIWGAQSLGLIPEPETKEDALSNLILVMDVGGLATTLSLVKQDKVISSTTLQEIGGESFVQQLVNKIFTDIDDPNLPKDAMSLELVNQNARNSCLELINKQSTTVHIPYLFMGRKPDEPHFETNVSRTLLEQITEDYWKSTTIPKLVDGGVLSSSLPPPTNSSSLFTSAITKVLEDSDDGLTPMDIKHVLVVGGGSRHNMFERACRDGIETLVGPSGGKIVLPDPAIRAELSSLGASALLPNFDYSYDNGLERA